MPDFITLTCPTCGAKLKVTEQIHLLACGHCGNEHMVVRDTGTLYLAPLAQDVRQIRVGVDKTAAELAIVRLAKEVEALETQRKSAEATAANDILAPDFWEQFFGGSSGIAFVVSALSFIIGQSRFALSVGGFFAVVIIGYIVFRETRLMRANNIKITRLERINVELNVKREQYRKNRVIAEG